MQTRSSSPKRRRRSAASSPKRVPRARGASPTRRRARLSGGSWQETLDTLRTEFPDVHASIHTRGALDVLKLRDLLVRAGSDVSASDKPRSIQALLDLARAAAHARQAAAAAQAAQAARAPAAAGGRKRTRSIEDEEAGDEEDVELVNPLLERVEQELAGSAGARRPLSLQEQQLLDYMVALVRDAARMHARPRAVEIVLESMVRDGAMSEADKPLIRGQVGRLIAAETKRRRKG